MWGLGDYPVTPEAHMRMICDLGNQCLSEVEQAIETVRKNRAEARDIYNSMKAYKLLTEYYERKVLAATAALIYGFGGPEHVKQEAEKFADEAVERYEVAAQFIWENIDRKTGNIKGRWLDGKPLTLPELIRREKQERNHLPALFGWSMRPNVDRSKDTGPKYGTAAPSDR
jgi:hypothetical protein